MHQIYLIMSMFYGLNIALRDVERLENRFLTKLCFELLPKFIADLSAVVGLWWCLLLNAEIKWQTCGLYLQSPSYLHSFYFRASSGLLELYFKGSAWANTNETFNKMTDSR